MGFWNRLGNVIKSYLDDEDAGLFGGTGRERASGDPDLDAAFEELNDFLGRNSAKSRADSGEKNANSAGGWNEDAETRAVPEELRPDFAELGLAFGASAGECKAAYKRLLKIHHPDRHARHADNFKKATDRTAKINAAYDRIEKWRQSR